MEDTVRRALDRFPTLCEVAVRPLVASPISVGYRTRVKLAVAHDRSGGRTRIGLFVPGTHDVVDIPECLVIHPGLRPLIDALRDTLVPFGELVHVDLRWSTAESKAHLTLVAGAPRPAADLSFLCESLMARFPFLIGAALRVAGRGPTTRALGGRTFPVAGEEYLVESLGGRRFRLSPGAFFQVNPAAAERLHEIVEGWLFPEGEPAAAHLADLYAGVGSFAVILAGHAARVTAVESVARAAGDARANAASNGIALDVVQEPAERAVQALRRQAVDRVVIDPPRRGLSAEVVRGLGHMRPERAAYASCDPETLARDLDALRVFGLAARAVVPLEMFPLTRSVETVALLEAAREPWRPRTLWRREGRSGFAVAVEKPALLPTHPAADEPSLLAAIRSGEGRGDLKPAHRLDVGTSGAVLFASGDALRELGRAFEERRMTKRYLALVRGVPRNKGRIARDGEETRYRRIGVVGGYGLVEVEPATGKQHQIRRHLSGIGHPILGDDRYGDRMANQFLAEICALNHPFLHLAMLELAAPNGEPLRLEIPLPPDLELVLERLEARRAEESAAFSD